MPHAILPFTVMLKIPRRDHSTDESANVVLGDRAVINEDDTTMRPTRHCPLGQARIDCSLVVRQER